MTARRALALNDNDGNSWINCCSFPAATTLAQTWNKELAYEMGNAVGEENYWLGGSAWYAPAINLHWSPFSGRNYEYYSEDSIISGKKHRPRKPRTLSLRLSLLNTV